MSAAPIVSILTPVYRPDMDHFKACVGSVVDQTSSDWELISSMTHQAMLSCRVPREVQPILKSESSTVPGERWNRRSEQ